jgi:hypothetical protein
MLLSTRCVPLWVVCVSFAAHQRKDTVRSQVETVLQQRVKAGVIQYQVRWQGYSSEHDSWLEEDRFDEGNVALAEFKRARKRRREDESSSSTGH